MSVMGQGEIFSCSKHPPPFVSFIINNLKRTLSIINDKQYEIGFTNACRLVKSDQKYMLILFIH